MKRNFRDGTGMAVLLCMGALGCARAPVAGEDRGATGEPAAASQEQEEAAEAEPSESAAPLEALPTPPRASNFLVLGGGADPSSNEIALEKNVLYFQRTLRTLGLPPSSATIYFANGNDGQATVRYLDEKAQERFKAVEISHLEGPASVERFLEWVERSAREAPRRPVFIYVTGHGEPNGRNLDNNNLALWDEDSLTVRAFGVFLGRLPSTTPVVTVMSQCFAGSFANFIYQDANPKRPVVTQPRCGFFATVKYRPSVGCTPEVNEADYRDYSSSFFAGLSGFNRMGKAVASADYDGDGRVSYAEAHAFAKVDGETTDWPISTSEAWLQRRARRKDRRRLLSAPIHEVMRTGRPEQRYVVESLVRKLGFGLERSWMDNVQKTVVETEEQESYAQRLRMELLNIGMQEKVRASAGPRTLAILERLLQCESGSWDVPPVVPLPVAAPVSER